MLVSSWVHLLGVVLVFPLVFGLCILLWVICAGVSLVGGSVGGGVLGEYNTTLGPIVPVACRRQSVMFGHCIKSQTSVNVMDPGTVLDNSVFVRTRSFGRGRRARIWTQTDFVRDYNQCVQTEKEMSVSSLWCLFVPCHVCRKI